jgi:hypothetical protein
MAEWYCFKDKEKMETAEINLLYLDIEAKQEGLRCPKCGDSYITEDVALDKVAKAEKMIEQK